MSDKKRNPSSRPPTRRSSKKHVNKGLEPDKKHLGPVAALLILIPVLAVFTAIIWYMLVSSENSSDLPDQANKDSGQAVVDRGADQAKQNSDSPQDSSWTTVSGQEQEWNEIDDAGAEGWGTEVVSDRVTDQWKKLKKILVSDKEVTGQAIGQIASADLVVHSVSPVNFETAFEDGQLIVRRGLLENDDQSQPFGQGADSLAAALTDLMSPFIDRKKMHCKVKVFRVTQENTSVTTRQTLEISGATSDGFREVNATWDCDWTNEKKPRLKSIRVTKYESVDSKAGRLFADCTESLLGSNESFQAQLLKGFDYWLERRQAHSAFALLANNGVAVGDVTGDGLEDVFLCQESGLPNLLFIQNPDGTLKDVSRVSGIDYLQNTSAALIIDINNDGHQDMAIAVGATIVIVQGDSTGTFKKRCVLDCADEVWSLTSADYDQDGLLDLYVGTYTPTGIASVAANVVLTMADFADGGLNSLFRNETTGQEFGFRNVTEETGLDINNRRKTYAAGWEDLDNDGDQDLYVANDFGWNSFYRNDRAEDGSVVFVDIAKQANALDDSFGMSVNFADYDRDGWMDIYISNMYSYAGNRITFQEQFKADSTDDVKKRFQRFAQGNTLLRNKGLPADGSDNSTLTFENRSMQTGVNMGRWAWCSCFLDMNNDGWEDLFVNNGYISASDSGDL